MPHSTSFWESVTCSPSNLTGAASRIDLASKSVLLPQLAAARARATAAANDSTLLFFIHPSRILDSIGRPLEISIRQTLPRLPEPVYIFYRHSRPQTGGALLAHPEGSCNRLYVECSNEADAPQAVGPYRRPPEASNVSPVSHPESVEARKTAIGAMSSGWAMRPRGVCASNCFCMPLPMKPAAWTPSVSTMPGLMELTRIFL